MDRVDVGDEALNMRRKCPASPIHRLPIRPLIPPPKKKIFDLPSNLLDDLTDESSALAQVTLGSGNTGLDDTGSGFL